MSLIRAAACASKGSTLQRPLSVLRATWATFILVWLSISVAYHWWWTVINPAIFLTIQLSLSSSILSKHFWSTVTIINSNHWKQEPLSRVTIGSSWWLWLIIPLLMIMIVADMVSPQVGKPIFTNNDSPLPGLWSLFRVYWRGIYGRGRSGPRQPSGGTCSHDAKMQVIQTVPYPWITVELSIPHFWAINIRLSWCVVNDDLERLKKNAFHNRTDGSERLCNNSKHWLVCRRWWPYG